MLRLKLCISPSFPATAFNLSELSVHPQTPPHGHELSSPCPGGMDMAACESVVLGPSGRAQWGCRRAHVGAETKARPGEVGHGPQVPSLPSLMLMAHPGASFLSPSLGRGSQPSSLSSAQTGGASPKCSSRATRKRLEWITPLPKPQSAANQSDLFFRGMGKEAPPCLCLASAPPSSSPCLALSFLLNPAFLAGSFCSTASGASLEH